MRWPSGPPEDERSHSSVHLASNGLGFVVGEVGRQVTQKSGVIRKRVPFRRFFNEEVEGVDDPEVGDEIHRDGELPGRLGEHEASQVVAERVLLPIDEVVLGRNCQRISQYRRPAVGSRPQAHDMRRKAYRPVEAVRHMVLQGDSYAHTRKSTVGAGVTGDGSIWK